MKQFLSVSSVIETLSKAMFRNLFAAIKSSSLLTELCPKRVFHSIFRSRCGIYGRLAVLSIFYSCMAGQIPSSNTAAQAIPVDSQKHQELRAIIDAGNRQLATRNFQEAIDSYKQALLLEPDNQIASSNIALAYNNWGIFLFSLNRFAEARDKWQEGLAQKPGDPRITRNLQILQQHVIRRGIKLEETPKDPSPNDSLSTTRNNSEDSSPDIIRDSESNKVKNSPPTENIKIMSAGKIISESRPSTKSSEPKSYNSSSATRVAPPFGSMKPSPIQNRQSNHVATKTNKDEAIEEIEAKEEDPEREAEIVLQKVLSNQIRKEEKSRITNSSREAVAKPAEITSKKIRSTDEKNRKNQNSYSSYPAVQNKLPDRIKGSASEISPCKAQDSAQEEFKETDDFSVDEKLAEMEKKVYGRIQKGRPIIKRLEKLEIDTSGSVSKGAIKSRIEKLIKTYGL